LGPRQSPDNSAFGNAPVLCVILFGFRTMISQALVAVLMIVGCLAVYVWINSAPL
jgi:hypothetical protein